MKRRVLFIGEAITLSHAVRPAVLAQALDPEQYEVMLACDPRYNALLPELPFPFIPLRSAISSERLLEALAGPHPLFEAPTLEAYIEEDLRLLREFSPDVVVGDMRQSLAVSSKLAGVPYVNMINAQWSPYATVELELPDNPMTNFVGEPLAQMFFKFTSPIGFTMHTLPLNLVRMKYGLPALGWDLKQVYSHGDYVLYPDIPGLIPTSSLPPTHIFLGPILWSPQVPLPEWWSRLPEDRPVVYVNLGSSGQPQLLELALEALAPLPVSVIAATAGRGRIESAPANAFLADYLPGIEAAGRARLVICNGGSMATQQALASGAPVLGLVSNLDQLASARAVSRAGAGEVLREREVSAGGLRRVVWRMLARRSYQEAAEGIAGRCRQIDAPAKFREVIDRIAATN